MSKSRGSVYMRGGTWYYKVYDSSGKVVLVDNCGNYDVIQRECALSVWGVRRIEIAGHYLQHSWYDILTHRLDQVPRNHRNKPVRVALKHRVDTNL